MPAGAIGACWAEDSWTDTCWEALTWAGLAEVDEDMNTRIATFLRTFYTAAGADVTMLAAKYLRDEKTGDYTARFQALIVDAS